MTPYYQDPLRAALEAALAGHSHDYRPGCFCTDAEVALQSTTPVQWCPSGCYRDPGHEGEHRYADIPAAVVLGAGVMA